MDSCTELDHSVLNTTRGGSSRVVVMERDYTCPVRKRKVLHKGCAYDSPACLTVVGIADRNLSKDTVADSYEELTRHARTDPERRTKQWRDLADAYEGYLCRRGHEATEVVFTSETERMTIDGKAIVRSTPARILRRILARHRDQGTTEFEHCEFIDDPEIVLDKTSHNIPKRMERLIAALERKKCGIRLRKAGRGRVRLETDEGVVFVER